MIKRTSPSILERAIIAVPNFELGTSQIITTIYENFTFQIIIYPILHEWKYSYCSN
jgi:hypothetical protein